MARLRSAAPARSAAVAGALAAALGATACGAATAPPSPTPTPLPVAVLQQRYLAAEATFEDVELPGVAAQKVFCDPTATTADLSKCASALSAQRQATIAFDDAIRGLLVPEGAQSLVDQLLTDDSRLELTLLQASTAPSLPAAAALIPQLTDLTNAAGKDADGVRRAIGLPPPSSSPSPAAT